MGVRITKNFGRLAREVKLSDRALMREVGLLARERVIRRTLSGKDQDGAGFKPYSARYRAQKGGGAVNLQVSGQMLQGITITDIGDDFVELGFKS